MAWNPIGKIFSKGAQSLLGIDIGTASLKIVEIKNEEGPELTNYVQLTNFSYLSRLREPIQSPIMPFLDSDVASMTRQALDAANIKTRRAAISIPLFSSFVTMLELPAMSSKELQNAVPYQAQQIVPVPLAEVILDWEVIDMGGGQQDNPRGSQKKAYILLVAVPREIVDKSVRIAKLVGLELESLEVESFGLVRSFFYGRDSQSVILIDIGSRATNLVIAERGQVRASRSVDISGSEMTLVLARSLGIEIGRAETLKRDYGISDTAPPDIKTLMTTVVDNVVNEIDKLLSVYKTQYGRNVDAMVLAGGSALLPGLSQHLNRRFQLPVTLDNPFANIKTPDGLSPALTEVGPSLSVAAGLALRVVSR